MELDVEVIRYLGHAYLPHIEVRILFGTLVDWSGYWPGHCSRQWLGHGLGLVNGHDMGWDMGETWVRHGSGHEPGRGSRHSP